MEPFYLKGIQRFVAQSHASKVLCFFCCSGYVKPALAMAFRSERVTLVLILFVSRGRFGQALVRAISFVRNVMNNVS